MQETSSGQHASLVDGGMVDLPRESAPAEQKMEEQEQHPRSLRSHTPERGQRPVEDGERQCRLPVGAEDAGRSGAYMHRPSKKRRTTSQSPGMRRGRRTNTLQAGHKVERGHPPSPLKTAQVSVSPPPAEMNREEHRVYPHWTQGTAPTGGGGWTRGCSPSSSW